MDSKDDGSVSTTTLDPPAAAILDNKGLLYFAAFCTIVFIVVGVVGNLLTIVALARCPRVRASATAAFITSLCVADFLFCALNLPFSASRFINQAWIHGDILCTLCPFLRYVNVGLSLMSITAITLNRYVLIVHPRAYPKIYQPKYIVTMIFVIWIFSVCLLIPTLMGVWGKFGYDPKILNCSILEEGGRSAKTFLFIFGFLLPCVAIVVCYARIFWAVRQSQKRMRRHGGSSHLEVPPPTTPISKNFPKMGSTKGNRDAVELKRRREEWRVTRMVLIIFCSFVVCYLPITIVKVMDKNVSYPALHIVGYILIFMSACINPIIYGLTNKQYRQAYKATILFRGRSYARASASQGNTGNTAQDNSSGNAARTVFSLAPAYGPINTHIQNKVQNSKSLYGDDKI